MPLPFVFNDKPADLIQVIQTAAVGANGPNLRPDVTLIQSLLNALPPGRGGPATALAVDGLSGPKTIAAIRGFQAAHRLLVDGRVDPGRATIRRLVPVLRDHGRIPVGVQGIGRPDVRIQQALGPGAIGHVGSLGAASATPWSFTGSSGGSISIGMLGATSGVLSLVSDAAPHTVRRLAFRGIGVGVSTADFALSLATPNMPGTGTRIRRGLGGMNRPLDNFPELAGTCVIGSISATAGNGVSACVVGFGAGAITSLYNSRAFGFLAGLQGGNQDAGISAYVGRLSVLG